MKASNLIVDPERRLWMIDLDGVRRARSPHALALFRRRDRERFLENWAPDTAARAVFEEHAFAGDASC